MPSIPPRSHRLVNQRQVGLIDYARGTQRVTLPLATEVVMGDSTELRINRSDKLIDTATFAGRACGQYLCYVSHIVT